jgi:hypothetical protein
MVAVLLALARAIRMFSGSGLRHEAFIMKVEERLAKGAQQTDKRSGI